MNTDKVTTRLAFRFPLGALVSDAHRLYVAFHDDPVGRAVLAHFPPGFAADFARQLERVSTLAAAQSNGQAAVGDLVKAQAAALAHFETLASAARRIARLAFRGHDVLLHEAFQVGVETPETISGIVSRGEVLLSACQKRAEMLAPFGWSPAKTAALQSALAALIDAYLTRHMAEDAKEGLTSQKCAAANDLYRTCLAIQGIARTEFPKSRLATDPSVTHARARFLLDGEFPTRHRRSAPPAVPAATMPLLAEVAAPGGSVQSDESEPAVQSVTPDRDVPADNAADLAVAGIPSHRPDRASPMPVNRRRINRWFFWRRTPRTEGVSGCRASNAQQVGGS